MRDFTGMFTAALLMAGALPLAAQQAPGQVGYWPLDESAGPSLDLSGSGISGAWLGGVLVPDTANKQATSFPNASALTFDGTDDSIDLGNPGVLPTGAAARTLSAWARPTSVGGTWAWIAAFGSPATGQAFFIGRNATTLYGGGYGDDINVPGFWAADVAHHISLSYDGTTARLYSDGVEILAAPKTWNLVAGTARIGRQVNGAAEFWTGQIDEVRIHSRVLSQTEIAILAGGLPAPTLQPAAPATGAITLTWNAPANAPAQTLAYPYTYRLYKSTSSGSGFTQIAEQTTLAYVDAAVTEGTTYYYRVTAVSAGESGPSAERSATPTPSQPRFNDHEEGFADGKCACGSAGLGGGSGAAFLGLLLLVLAAGSRR